MSSVPVLAEESLGELISRIQDALRAGDEDALARRFARLAETCRGYTGLVRSVGVNPADVADVLQQMQLKMFVWLRANAYQRVENADGWVWTIAKRAALDHVRQRKGRLQDEELAKALEVSGVHAMRALHDAIHAERELAEMGARLHAYVQAYALAARAETPRGWEHVYAWYYLRVEGRLAHDVAALVGAERFVNGGRDAVWQWAGRGRNVVLALAARDPDLSRGAAMRAAALETG